MFRYMKKAMISFLLVQPKTQKQSFRTTDDACFCSTVQTMGYKNNGSYYNDRLLKINRLITDDSSVL